MTATLGCLAVVLITLLSGCTGTNGPEGPPGMDDDALVYDLTTPPTREELGFEAGERGLALGRPAGGELLDVTVLLPGGTQLKAQAFRVDSVGYGAEMIPGSLNVYTIAEDMAAADQALTDAAELLGLSAESVRRGRVVLAREPNPLGTGTIVELNGPKLDYLSPGLGLRRNEPREDVTVTYSFFWGQLDPPVSAPPA